MFDPDFFFLFSPLFFFWLEFLSGTEFTRLLLKSELWYQQRGAFLREYFRGLVAGVSQVIAY